MITKAQNWQRPRFADDSTLIDSVATILNDIADEGDTAIERYAEKFDGQKPEFIELKSFDEYQLDAELSNAIQLAAKRIRRFAEFQFESLTSRQFEDDYGFFGQAVKPIEKVGAYIPGGRFPLISTALMTLIPARVVGCSSRVACSPSDHPAILAAASLAGATQFVKLGGVQAVGALTNGYQSIEPVDLIVGPGNAWVNEAKRQVQSKVKIDGLAGPSELMAICDDQQPIDWLALDALAQAEHDPNACSLIVSDSQSWLTEMLSYLEKNKDTRELIKNEQVALVYANNKADMIAFSEDYAPEHLMLCHNAVKADELNNYGSLFIGANSAVALGDYISGPNHTLPTLGYAKQTGGLSVNTFVKIQTIQQVNKQGRETLSEAAKHLAKAEGLEFHFQSLVARCQ
ncbi:histidinol dehydrogenase [Aliikangiella marina]|uniref:Histidinol dehydrogenase n=1 Tax=Aliikangiella marina TaxID=1712262 RepID=A0A545T929_9GAMM|nr:histidinol dehydrogenase [Aliikangiella marina]TQV73709.1 histidinol dehydrogenase [Aliikangiella marina]